MPNENEYKEGEKRYVKRIRKSSCDREYGDIYRVKCKVTQSPTKSLIGWRYADGQLLPDVLS